MPLEWFPKKPKIRRREIFINLGHSSQTSHRTAKEEEPFPPWMSKVAMARQTLDRNISIKQRLQTGINTKP